jgi:hypothetical protein
MKSTCDELPQVPVRKFMMKDVSFNTVKIPNVTGSMDHKGLDCERSNIR